MTYYFSSTPSEWKNEFVQRRPPGDHPPNPDHIAPRPTIFQQKSLTAQQQDSVSLLSSEALFTDGFDYSKDSVFIHLMDTVYRIKRNYKE